MCCMQLYPTQRKINDMKTLSVLAALFIAENETTLSQQPLPRRDLNLLGYCYSYLALEPRLVV
jgi:hypothetical protein